MFKRIIIASVILTIGSYLSVASGQVSDEPVPPEKALKFAEREIQANPNDSAAWLHKGLAYNRLEEYDSALVAFEKAIDITPKYAEAWTVKGIILRKLGRYKEALKAHWKAQEINPEYAEAWNNEGVVLHELEKYYQAYWAFRRAVKLHSKFRLGWKNMGRTCLKLGKYGEAARAYQRAAALAVELEGREDEQALYNMGIALVKLGRYGEAVQPLRKVTQYPDSASAHINLGQVFLNIGDLSGARRKLADALNIDEDHAAVLSLKGRIEIEEEEYDSAIASFERAIPLDMGNPLLLLWHAYAKYLKAEFSSESKGKDYPEETHSIIRGLERAEKLCQKPVNEEIRGHILYFLGYFYYKTKDMFAAKEKLEECIKLKSSIKPSARELLDHIWNYQIRPSWWRWWWESPIYGWKTAFAIVFLAAVILVLFWLPAFKPKWFSSEQRKEIKALLYILYISFIALLVISLVSPSIERIKAKDIELELRAPLTFEFVLSPAIMEMKITALEDAYPER